MAVQPLLDCDIYVGGYDLASDVNEVSISDEYAELDKTNFASGGSREYVAGLHTTTVDVNGFLNTATGQSEPVLRSVQGSVNTLMGWTPNATANDAAYLLRVMESKLSKGGKVGELMPISAHFVSNADEGALTGNLLLPKTSISSNGSATGYQNGAVSSTQRLYAGAFVFSVAGSSTPTLTLKVQSDDNGSFTSATDRITFTDFTAIGSELQELAGAVTDDYWRVNYALSGTDPVFSAAVIMAIAA